MTIGTILAAEARYHADTALPHKLVAEARHFASRARSGHPAGFAAVDRELAEGLAKAGKLPPGGEQLLCIEALRQAMADRVSEADAEDRRQHNARFEQNLSATRNAMREAGRQAWAARACRATSDAIRSLRARLDIIERDMAAVTDDAGLVDRIADIDEAVRVFSTTVGVERREARNRIAAARAAAAIVAIEVAAATSTETTMEEAA